MSMTHVQQEVIESDVNLFIYVLTYFSMYSFEVKPLYILSMNA